MQSETAKLENINKFSKYGLRRRPTYQEIIGLLDENKKLGLPLPNRDATFLRNSPEGSFFDGIHQMEDLKDEQQRLLLRQMNDLLMRQNIRTAGRTLHTERARLNAFRPPQIVEANMEVDADGNAQPTMKPTTVPPSTRMQQASQLNLELQQRGNTAQKRREEIAMNEAEQIRKMTKPTLQEQLLGLQPPRTIPENIPIFSSGDEALQPTKVKRKNLNATVSASSSQAPQPMNTTSQPKRDTPETRVEPRGKAGRPKMFKYGTDRADGTKRDGDEPEDTTNRKKSKRTNKNKEKIQRRLEAKMAKETVNVEANDADDEDTRKGSRVRKTIEKPKSPSQANIQTIYEELTNAKNKNTITAEEYKKINDVFQAFRKAKGKAKPPQTAKAKEIYKKLYPKLKKKYDEMK
jgi:hypothetical protein